MWYSHFDKIFLINLPERPNRLEASILELTKYGIPYEIVPAIKEENGAYGLFKTMRNLFSKAELENWSNILVFEDDLQILHHDFNQKMNTMMEELNTINWDLFYLGGNVNASLKQASTSELFFHCNYILSTHAVAYSKEGWQKCLRALQCNPYQPIDNLWMDRVQRKGMCYISNPLLVTQRRDYSDILKQETDYTRQMQIKFNERLNAMKHGVV